MSRTARERTAEAVEEALCRVGPPWCMGVEPLFGIVTDEERGTTTVVRHEDLVKHMRGPCDPAIEHEVRALFGALAERPFDIPHLVLHAGGAELEFITPPDGAQA